MDEAGETPKALEVMQAIGLSWHGRGDPLRAAACYLAAIATPGLDARVREGIENWYLPPLRAAIEPGMWSRLEAQVLARGYRETVTALLRRGTLPLPGEG
jgi:hypothetical protein